MDNPNFQDQAMRVAEQVEAVTANPNFQDQAKRVAEQMEALVGPSPRAVATAKGDSA